MLPGLSESHAHLFNTGILKIQLDLRDAKSFDDVVKRVGERVKTAKKGEWIIGTGWDQNKWEDKVLPSHDRISALTPDNPVELTRVDYHTHLVNKAAMQMAKIKKDTQDPEGGKIVRDPSGNPTGILMDKAFDLLVASHIPALTFDGTKKAILLALQEALKFGITSFTDAYVKREQVNVLNSLAEEGKLPLRVHAFLAFDDQALVNEYLAKGPRIKTGKNQHLTIRAIKILADGGLGARSAAVLQPYKGEPNNTGILRVQEDEIYQFTKQALQAGFQVATHGVGDRTNRAIINAYEKAMTETKAQDPRLRIEHLSLIGPTDLPRLAKLGIGVAIQPLFCRTQCPYVADRIGLDAAEAEAFVWRALLNAGVNLMGSSDSPVESMNPYWGIYSAVTRQSADGTPKAGWYPKQKLTLNEAVALYTTGAAYGVFEEKERGRIEVGKFADFTVLSANPFKEGVETLLTTQADYTIVSGKIVFQRKVK